MFVGIVVLSLARNKRGFCVLESNLPNDRVQVHLIGQKAKYERTSVHRVVWGRELECFHTLEAIGLVRY